MHGKTSDIKHNHLGVFKSLDSPMIETRYHSLVIDQETLPDCLQVTAWTENDLGSMDEIMAVQHKQYAIQGIQFHPESILSEYGHEILANFLKLHC